jgi:hypothetical protein
LQAIDQFLRKPSSTATTTTATTATPEKSLKQLILERLSKSNTVAISKTLPPTATDAETEQLTPQVLQDLRNRIAGRPSSSLWFSKREGQPQQQQQQQQSGSTDPATIVATCVAEHLVVQWQRALDLCAQRLTHWEGFPAPGTLTSETEVLPRHLATFLQHLLSPMMAQTLTNALDSLGVLLEVALTEDRAGHTADHAVAALYVLAKLHITLQRIAKMLQQSFTTKISPATSSATKGPQFIRYKVHDSDVLPMDMAAVMHANKESLRKIFRNYGDLIVEDMFPIDVRHHLRTLFL